MAAVIRAHDIDLGRTVALKILPPDMAADPENISRFKQEARAAAKLDHENVARVYFCGEDQGLNFIAFEFVEGENLRVRMEKNGGMLPVAESLHYLIQIAAGLSHAASRSVVHRDIKPSNIIITPEGKAKIVDMGLARNLDPRMADGQLTQSGVTLGTFDYISPEQAIEPRSADSRSDLYSLGCTFYHVLTGHLPVPEGTAAKKLHCHQHVAPLDPRELNPAIPDELASVLGKMMAKNPAQRYQHPDQLLQHLLLVAQKLNLHTGPILSESGARLSPYAEHPLPAPPGISPLWIGVAVVVLAVGLFALTGGFGGGNRQPLDTVPPWQQDKAKEVVAKDSGKESIKSNDVSDVPERTKAPRMAANTAELVNLLKLQVRHIKLSPGIVYDLTHVNRKDAELPAALFEGSDLVLETTERIDYPPTVKLLMAPADDGTTSRPGSLTIRGSADGAPAKVRLRGIRFEFVANDQDPGQSGISLFNVDQIEIKDCTFVSPAGKGLSQDGPAVISIVQQLSKDAMPLARLDRCYFAPGSVGVQVSAPAGQTIRATECAFGPQFAAFRVKPAGNSDANMPIQLRLESCSALMNNGAIVEIGDQVPCKVQAGWCLFSDPDLPDMERPRAFLMRQLGVIANDTRFSPCEFENTMLPMPNGYHKVLAFAAGEHAYTFDDCKTEMVNVEDSTARLLAKHPWKEKAPIARLFASPSEFREVFNVDLKQEILRLDPDKNRNLLGVKNLQGLSVYDLWPYPSVQENRILVNQKVWCPEFPGDDKSLPPNVYRSLNKAIEDLKEGDTLLIRHNGKIEMLPAVFEKADITIKPDQNCRPILIPRVPTLKKDTALFKLFSGQIVFENLRFRLKPDRAPAIISLPGGAQCTFRHCTATLEEGDDLSVVSLADPKGEMMMGTSTPEKWPAPRITIEDSFIRGKGRMVHVRGSRPFDLRAKNSLVVLDGSMIDVEPASADLSEATPAQVTLDRVTAYLTRNLLHERASEKRTEMKGIGLAPIHIHGANSLFVPASDQAALVVLERLDMSDFESIFQWKDCRQNVYGYKSGQAMLIVQPENVDATKPQVFERDRWLERWREIDPTFGDVSFAKVQASKRYDGANLSDFAVQSIGATMKLPEPLELGAPIEALGKRSVEE